MKLTIPNDDDDNDNNKYHDIDFKTDNSRKNI